MKIGWWKYYCSKTFFLDTEENENSLKFKTQKLEYSAFPEAIIKIYRKN